MTLEIVNICLVVGALLASLLGVSIIVRGIDGDEP
jgi:hypothetical protein